MKTRIALLLVSLISVAALSGCRKEFTLRDVVTNEIYSFESSDRMKEYTVGKQVVFLKAVPKDPESRDHFTAMWLYLPNKELMDKKNKDFLDTHSSKFNIEIHLAEIIGRDGIE